MDELIIDRDYIKIILRLIRDHYDKDEEDFKNISLNIAKQFEDAGRMMVNEFILAHLDLVDTLVPMKGD